jgi:hypothetical protein
MSINSLDSCTATSIGLLKPSRAASVVFCVIAYGMAVMDASFLFELAHRCITAADESADNRAKQAFREIARELILKANELDAGQEVECRTEH